MIKQNSDIKATSNRFARVIKTGLLISLLVLSIVAIFNYAFSCDRTIVKVILNQTSDRLAVQYNLDCAALSGSTNFVVLSSQYQLYYLIFFEPNVTTEYDYGRKIEISWTTPKSILLSIPSTYEIYRKDDEVKAVSIRYGSI